MDVANSVRKAIDDWERKEAESAMLHACNAVDGTAKKVFPKLGNRDRFTRLLRENYSILGPMGAPGIDLVKTRLPIKIKAPSTPDGKPDIADVVYGIHRCCHAHGEELPDGFQLVEDAAGPTQHTRMRIERGAIRLSDRMIFALIAVAVLSPVNAGAASPRLEGYFLTFGKSAKLIINEWWGRAQDFPTISSMEPMPLIELDFRNWVSNSD